MPFANNKGVQIHYQVEGEGPPLVLQHGYGNALDSWHELGYVDALRDKHQLILIDARGHGASDKPHETRAYTNECQAADVIAVLQDRGIRRADYWGYSMGGRIGFAIAQYAPDWVRSLIIGGAAADGRSRIGDGIRAAIRRGGLEGLMALFPDASPTYKARLLASDINALEACRTDSLGFADILPSMMMPCLVYAGSADSIFPLVEETVAEMPNVTFFNLPGLKHSETNVRSDLVLPHVIDFLGRLDRGTA
jgi:pimeloyl-ACP methyl ester carboxylesterase